MMRTMNLASEQDARGEHPGIVPANGTKVDGVWRWQDEHGNAFCWRPGDFAVRAWSATLHISSRMPQDEPEPLPEPTIFDHDDDDWRFSGPY